MTFPINRAWDPNYLVQWYFGQSEFWITAAGDKVLISKMGDGHAVNTLLMLERVAADIEKLLGTRGRLGGGVPVTLQETELYQALHKKVMAAVGEAMPPLDEPEIDEQPAPTGLEGLLGHLFKGPAAEDGDSPPQRSWLDSPGFRTWVYEKPKIEELLIDALQNDFDVILDYTDLKGRETRNRRLRVTGLREMQSITKPFPETRIMVKDRDADDEVKSFYLSRVNRARRA